MAGDLNAAAKQRYLRLKLLHSVVHLTANDKRNDNKQITVLCNPSNDNLKYSIKHLLALNSACLHIQNYSSLHLGVTDKFAESYVTPLRKGLSQIVELKKIKEIIQDQCLKVRNYCQQLCNITKVSDIPKLIKDEKANMELFRLTISKKKQYRNELMHKYFQEAVSCVNLAIDILKTYQSQAEVHSTLATFHSSTINAVLIKAQILKLELLYNTYNQDTVSSLKIIQDYLHKQKNKLDNDLREKSISLQTYKSAGLTFQRIAEEYASLYFDIRNEMWAIEEIDKVKCAEN